MARRRDVDLSKQRISCPIPGIKPLFFVLPARSAVSAETALSPFMSSFLRQSAPLYRH